MELSGSGSGSGTGLGVQGFIIKMRNSPKSSPKYNDFYDGMMNKETAFKRKRKLRRQLLVSNERLPLPPSIRFFALRTLSCLPPFFCRNILYALRPIHSRTYIYVYTYIYIYTVCICVYMFSACGDWVSGVFLLLFFLGTNDERTTKRLFYCTCIFLSLSSAWHALGVFSSSPFFESVDVDVDVGPAWVVGLVGLVGYLLNLIPSPSGGSFLFVFMRLFALHCIALHLSFCISSLPVCPSQS